jgi:hypothetical protein
MCEQFERRALSEFGTELLQKRHVGQGVTRSLKEQQRDLHLEEVPPSVGRWATGSVEGKGKEDEAQHARQRREGLGLRRHAPAIGSSTREEGQVWSKAVSCGDRSADGGVRYRWWIRTAPASLHERKLVSEGCDPSLGEVSGQALERGVRHPCTGSMGEHKAGAGIGWPKPQA